jgi:hypothetical protein
MPILALLAVLAGAPLTEPVPGPAPRNQYQPRAASNGDGYLVLWTDQRAYPQTTYATRVSAEGEVLDRTGIRLSETDMFGQSMVWAGTSYVIAWMKDDKFWLMRIDADGNVVDGPRVVMDHAHPWSMAFDGTHIVITYVRPDGIYWEPHALFLTREAEVVKDVKLADQGDFGPPIVASNGSHFVAVWQTMSVVNTVRSVDGVRFTIDGPGPVVRLLHDARQIMPRLTSDGRDFLLLLYDDHVFRHAARHVSADLGTVGAAVMLPAALRDAAMALWVGDHYVVTGDNGATISATRLDRNGQLLDTGTIQELASSGSAPGSSSATNGRDVFVTWAGAQNPPSDVYEPLDIYGATASGTTLARTSSSILSIASPRQFDPAVASSGTNLLTVWSEASGVYARRNALDGRPLDASPLRLADRAEHVSVVFDGAGYVVAWSNGSELVTRRIAVSGGLTTSGGARVALDSSAPLALASDGDVTLLAWASRDGVKAVRLGKNATFADTVPLTLTSDDTISALSVAASDGGDFLVAWGDTFFTEHGGMNPVNVLAARVTRSLLNLDPNGFEIAATPAGEGYPSVAWNGSEWLVVWQRGNEIHGRRVARDRTLLDDDTLLATNARLPRLAWNGGYTLAWTAGLPYGPNTLHAARFPRLGAPLTGVTTLGEVEAFGRQSAFLAPVGGTVVIAYARIAREPAYGGVMRAFLTELEAPRRRSARH